MPALLEFQRAMRRALLAEGPEALGEGPEALGEGSAARGEGPDAVVTSEAPRGLTAEHGFLADDEETQWRLAVYRDTVRSTLSQALALTYPAVRRLVGAEFFAGAAQAFLSAQLPRSACLNDYGAQFPTLLTAFIAKHAPAASLSYLADVATLEWAVNCALHAPDRPPLALERLAALPASAMPTVRLVPHPSLSLLFLDHPADSIWRAVLDSDDAAMAAVDLHGGPVRLLVERAGQQVRVQRLDEPAARFTQRLFAGESLQAALGVETAPEVIPEVAPEVIPEVAPEVAPEVIAEVAPDGTGDVAPGVTPDPTSARQTILAEHLSCGRFVDFLVDVPIDFRTNPFKVNPP